MWAHDDCVERKTQLMYKCFLLCYPPLTAALDSVPAWGFQGSGPETFSCLKSQRIRFPWFVGGDVSVFRLRDFQRCSGRNGGVAVFTALFCLHALFYR